MQNKIFVDTIKHNTADYLMTSLERTMAHNAKMLHKTGDLEGFQEVAMFIDDLESYLKDYFDVNL